MEANPNQLRGNAVRFDTIQNNVDDAYQNLQRLLADLPFTEFAHLAAAKTKGDQQRLGHCAQLCRTTAQAVEAADNAFSLATVPELTRPLTALLESSPFEHLVTHPDSPTLASDRHDFSEWWTSLPIGRRQHLARMIPVVLLDRSLADPVLFAPAELDSMILSLSRNAAPVRPPHDPQLEARLDDISDHSIEAPDSWSLPIPTFDVPSIDVPSIDIPGIDIPEIDIPEIDLPRINRVDVALARAQAIAEAGDAGRAYRDAVNAPVTWLAMAIGLRAGKAQATARREPSGLIVVEVPDDASLLRVDTVVGAFELPPMLKGGTVYGNTFIVPNNNRRYSERGQVEKRTDSTVAERQRQALIKHETRHSYQWAGAGLVEYPLLYALEAAKSSLLNTNGTFPYFTGDTGCKNRFEQDAGLEAGGYHC